MIYPEAGPAKSRIRTSQKRVFFSPVLLCLALLFTSCGGGGQSTSETAYTSLQISQEILDSQSGPVDMVVLSMGDDSFDDYLRAYYDMEEDMLQDGVICYVSGIDASEVAVLHLAPEAEHDAVEESLLRYIDERIGDFYGYMPDQVLLLEQAVVTSSGSYIALLICEDSQAAQDAFARCFSGEAAGSAEDRPEPATTSVTAAYPEGDYDAAAVLEAWKTGDSSGLSDKSRRILEACTTVINALITDGMSLYEQELAIHDWIIQWAEYDVEVKSRDEGAQPHPDNDNPYGILAGRRGTCAGYTSTFQLFMDMLEIECITVEGTSRSDNDHAWNMVRLDDGEWYCVDVTWDDPIGLNEYNAVIQHEYFNVTSHYLRNNTPHQWDEDAVPEAEGLLYQWKQGSAR